MVTRENYYFTLGRPSVSREQRSCSLFGFHRRTMVYNHVRHGLQDVHFWRQSACSGIHRRTIMYAMVTRIISLWKSWLPRWLRWSPECFHFLETNADRWYPSAYTSVVHGVSRMYTPGNNCRQMTTTMYHHVRHSNYCLQSEIILVIMVFQECTLLETIAHRWLQN